MGVVVQDFDKSGLQELRQNSFFRVSEAPRDGISVIEARADDQFKPNDAKVMTGNELSLVCQECGPASAYQAYAGARGMLSGPAGRTRAHAEQEVPAFDWGAAIEDTGVLITLNECGSSNDDLYRKKPQLNQTLYTGYSYVFIRQLAIALRVLFLPEGSTAFPSTPAALWHAADGIEQWMSPAAIPATDDASMDAIHEEVFSADAIHEEVFSADAMDASAEDHAMDGSAEDATPINAEASAEAFLARLRLLGVSEELCVRGHLFWNTLRHIVRKIKQAVENGTMDGPFDGGPAEEEPDRPQVLLNMECAGSAFGAHVFDLDDLATLISFGFTVQVGDFTSKKMIQLWESAEHTGQLIQNGGSVEQTQRRSGKFLSEADGPPSLLAGGVGAMGPNPFVRLNPELSGSSYPHEPRHRSEMLMQSAMPEDVSAEVHEEFLSKRVPATFAALFSDPDAAAFRVGYMGGTIIMTVKDEFLR